MNPTLFDPNTPNQRTEAFVQDLLYYPEHDGVRSMHNSLVNPNSFVPPPRVQGNEFSGHEYSKEYYPTSSGFFSADPLAAYQNLVSTYGKKPYHLLEYDLRFTEKNNYFT